MIVFVFGYIFVNIFPLKKLDSSALQFGKVAFIIAVHENGLYKRGMKLIYCTGMKAVRFREIHVDTSESFYFLFRY